jgi:hypothetical protein
MDMVETAVLQVNLNQNIGQEKNQIIVDIGWFTAQIYVSKKIFGDLSVLKVNYRRFPYFCQAQF